MTTDATPQGARPNDAEAQQAAPALKSLLHAFCHLDKAPKALAEVQTHLGIDGIYLQYQNLLGDQAADQLVAAASTSMQKHKVALKKALKALSAQAPCTETSLTLAGKPYQAVLINELEEKHVDGRVLFLSQSPLPAASQLQAAADGIFTGLVATQLKLQIALLQNNLRYQVIWSESMEWAKTVEVANNDFFKSLMQRSSLIVNASCAAIYIHSARARHSEPPQNGGQWLYRHLDPALLEQVIAAQGDLDFFCPEQTTTRFFTPTDSPELVALGSFMLVPVRRNEQILASLVLLKPKAAFGILDEIYVSQLLNQTLSNIERHALLSELKVTNQKILEEKQEQLSLIDKLESTQQQLMQSEKMASIGQLAAGVAHEINNPIGYVSSNINSLSNYVKDLLKVIEQAEQVAGESEDPGMQEKITGLIEEYDIEFLKSDINELLRESQEGIKRVKHIVQDLKDFSHVEQAEMQLADLHKCLDSTLNIVNNELKYTCTIEKRYGQIPHIECVSSQLNQVFMNLLVNAGHAIEKEGLIIVETLREGDQVKVKITDNGKGIDPKNMRKLFEPFFTTKPVGKGTGLGLSISYGIVQKHHGHIEVESTLGKGTTFTITLPIQQPEQPGETPAAGGNQ